MVNVETLPAVYARIENRPGSLERAARCLGERRINIEAIGLETNGGIGFVRVLTPRAKEAIEALHAHGLEAYESSLIVANVPNRAGELTKATSEITAAGINVESVITTTDGRLAFRTSDNERAAQILRKM